MLHKLMVLMRTMMVAMTTRLAMMIAMAMVMEMIQYCNAMVQYTMVQHIQYTFASTERGSADYCFAGSYRNPRTVQPDLQLYIVP